jgi:hypothetical protein
MGRLDRYGDPIENDDAGGPGRDAGTDHDPRCHGGWLGEDAVGRPIPCLACRPHLRPKHHKTGSTA